MDFNKHPAMLEQFNNQLSVAGATYIGPWS